jgi:transposase-like protein
MAAAKPLTDQDRQRVAALHAAGRTRNEIAREIGRSGATVSKLARELGLSFDRTATAAATEAKVLDAKARRAALMLELLDDAARLRSQMFAPTVVHAFGGKENTYAAAEIPEPTFADKRNIMQATATAISTSLRLDQHDGDGTTDSVGSLLGSLFDNLQAKHAPADTDANG